MEDHGRSGGGHLRGEAVPVAHVGDDVPELLLEVQRAEQARLGRRIERVAGDLGAELPEPGRTATRP